MREINQEKEREQEERAKSEQSKHSNPIAAPERSAADNQIFSPETAGENHVIVPNRSPSENQVTVPPKTSSVGGNQVIVSDKPSVRETDVVDVIANKKSIHQDMGLSAIVLKPQPSSQSNGTKRSFTVPHTKRHKNSNSPIISSAVNRSNQVSTSSPLQDAAETTQGQKPVSKDAIYPESDNSTALNSRIKNSENSSNHAKNAQRNDSTTSVPGTSDKELDTINKKKDGDGGDVNASVRSGVSLLRMRGNIITFRKRVAEKAKSKKATPTSETIKSDTNDGPKVEDNNVVDKDKVEEKLLDVPKVKMRFFNGTGKAI